MKNTLAAAVLCGGRGERLRPLTDYFQKTMIPIGERRRPLLEYVVRLLVFHGVKSITLLTGYRTDEIRDYFKDGSAYGVEIRYSRDQEDNGGSLGALSNALRNGSIADCETLVVYYGDILSNLNIAQLVKTHKRKNADTTLVLSKNYTLPVGVANVRHGRVVRMEEKPEMDISVTVGCVVLGPKAMRIATRLGRRRGGDLMSDFVPGLLRRKLVVAAYYTRELWHDIGTLASYERINSEVKDNLLPFL